MKFCADFGAEFADRLSPFKNDKLKDAEISPFQAGSDIYCHAEYLLCTLFRGKSLFFNIYPHFSEGMYESCTVGD